MLIFSVWRKNLHKVCRCLACDSLVAFDKQAKTATKLSKPMKSNSEFLVESLPSLGWDQIAGTLSPLLQQLLPLFSFKKMIYTYILTQGSLSLTITEVMQLSIRCWDTCPSRRISTHEIFSRKEWNIFSSACWRVCRSVWLGPRGSSSPWSARSHTEWFSRICSFL